MMIHCFPVEKVKISIMVAYRRVCHCSHTLLGGLYTINLWFTTVESTQALLNCLNFTAIKSKSPAISTFNFPSVGFQKSHQPWNKTDCVNEFK